MNVSVVFSSMKAPHFACHAASATVNVASPVFASVSVSARSSHPASVCGLLVRYPLHLMKLADLDRNILEHGQESAPAVDDDRTKRPPRGFRDLPSVVVVRHAFSLDLVPPDRPLERDGKEHAHAVCASPEGRVDDEDSFLRSDAGQRDFDSVETRTYPHVRVFCGSGKLCERLLAANVRLPQFLAQLLAAASGLKRSSAFKAAIPLDASGRAVLFC
jgi:hypothetical protein